MLRNSLILVIPLLSSIDLSAQGREKVLNTDTGRVVLHYFTSGQVSTRTWMDKDDRWGRTWAYKRDGSVIVEHQTRRIAGHASVHFEYHANGAISKAEYSDAPDGGIQWYRSTTTFDENGNKTGFTEQGHDNDGLIPRPDMRFVEKPQVVGPQKPVAECQKLYVNEVLVVNSTKWRCTVKVEPKQPSPALPAGTFTLQPGDTLRAGTFTMGETCVDPTNHVTLTVQRAKSKGIKPGPMEVPLLQQQQVSKEHRQYIYHALPEGTRLKLTR
jgi:hypothetical protein